MNRSTKRWILLFILPVLAAQLLLGGCTMPMYTMCVDEADNPQNCFEEFFGCLRSGNYEEADTYLSNYRTLGFGSLGSDEFSSLLDQHLSSSRSARVTETVFHRGFEATLRIEYTTFDFKKFEPVLTEATTQKVHDLQYEGQTVEGDDQYEALMLECANELLLAPQDYYTTKSFLLDFEKIDGEWKMICTDEFYSALVGYTI